MDIYYTYLCHTHTGREKKAHKKKKRALFFTSSCYIYRLKRNDYDALRKRVVVVIAASWCFRSIVPRTRLGFWPLGVFFVIIRLNLHRCLYTGSDLKRHKINVQFLLAAAVQFFATFLRIADHFLPCCGNVCKLRKGLFRCPSDQMKQLLFSFFA